MRFRQVVFVLGVVFSFAVGATAQEEALSDTLKAIAFSPDGKLLVSGSSNKTVSLWDFEGLAPVWGDSVGFRVSEGAKIEVDYVKITVP